MDAPTILRPVRAKSHVYCYALTGRKEKHMAIPQGVALGYKIKGFQPTRYYHVNEYAERKFCSSATLVNYHLYNQYHETTIYNTNILFAPLLNIGRLYLR